MAESLESSVPPYYPGTPGDPQTYRDDTDDEEEQDGEGVSGDQSPILPRE